MVPALTNEVEVRTAGHLLNLQVDTSVAHLRLSCLRDLRPRIAKRREDERQAFDYIEEVLHGYGLTTRRYTPTCLVSLPLSGALEVNGEPISCAKVAAI